MSKDDDLFLSAHPDVPPPRPPKPAYMKGLPGPPPKGPAPHPPPSRPPPPVPPPSSQQQHQQQQRAIPPVPPPSSQQQQQQQKQQQQQQRAIPPVPPPSSQQQQQQQQRAIPPVPPPSSQQKQQQQQRAIPPVLPGRPKTIPQRPTKPAPQPASLASGSRLPLPPPPPPQQQQQQQQQHTQPPPLASLTPELGAETSGPANNETTTTTASSVEEGCGVSVTSPPLTPVTPSSTTPTLTASTDGDNEKSSTTTTAYGARKARRARRRQAIVLTQEDINSLFKTQEGETDMSYMEVAAALAKEGDDDDVDGGAAAVSTTTTAGATATTTTATATIASTNGANSNSNVTVPMNTGIIFPGASRQGGITSEMTQSVTSQANSASAAATGKGGKGGKKEKGPDYEALLELAQQEEVGDLDKMEFLFTSGFDAFGRTILVLIGANLPSRSVPLDRLFLYFLRTLDPVVEREYVLVYFAKGQSAENRPPFSWLRRAYSLFNRKYKKNLKGLYVVQPTTWLRMVLRFFRPFVSKKFWAKVHLVPSFEGIYEYISPSQLHLPGAYVEKAATMRPLFGEALDVVVQNPTQASGGVPTIVTDCIAYLYEHGLDAEGLLRISGNRAAINELRLAYDGGKQVDLTQCDDPHTVANLLKLYLRELPEPVFTYDLYRPLLRVQEAQGLSDQQRIDALAGVLAGLPQPNRLVLWHLVSFAEEFARHAAHTKMTPDNIALCLAPTLMWCRPEELTPASAITEMGLVNSIFKTILLNKNCIIQDSV